MTREVLTFSLQTSDVEKMRQLIGPEGNRSDWLRRVIRKARVPKNTAIQADSRPTRATTTPKKGTTP